MRTRWSLALLPLLVGCGGGGGGAAFVQGSTGAVSLTLTGGANYNGSTAAFVGYTSLDGSSGGHVVTLTATNSTRAVELSVIDSDLKTGSVVDLTGNTGSTVLYIDPVGRWVANSGTITVNSRTSSGVQLTLTNVVLANSPATTGAAGTVTLSGTMSFVAS